MKAARLRTEHLAEPVGIGIPSPRFDWNCEDSVAQSAHHVVARRHGEAIWGSGKVRSDRMLDVQYEGMPLGSCDRIDWSVTPRDHGVESEPVSSWFELGLSEEKNWAPPWIAGDHKAKRSERGPVDHFRKKLTAQSEVRSARLYISACGLYEAHINSKRAGDFRLAPGSTDYRRRLQNQNYGVTELLAEENTIELSCADGWYRGSIGCVGPTNVFGRQTRHTVAAGCHIFLWDPRRAADGESQ